MKSVLQGPGWVLINKCLFVEQMNKWTSKWMVGSRKGRLQTEKRVKKYVQLWSYFHKTNMFIKILSLHISFLNWVSLLPFTSCDKWISGI